jgi:hypothetical protein
MQETESAANIACQEWSYRAKNSTFRALTRAGFNRRTFPELRDFLLVTEPEAAAVYTARQQKELMGADFLNASPDETQYMVLY